MAVAIASGVAPDVWIDHPRALFTAVEILNEQTRKAKPRGR